MGILSLIATIGADVAPFERGMHQVRKIGLEVGNQLKGHIAAAFGAAAIEEFVRHTLNAMVQVADFAAQTGLTTDEVQKLDKAAKEVGLTFEEVASGLNKFGAARKKALFDDEKMREKMGEYGITKGDLEATDTLESNITIVRKLADALHGVKPTQQQRDDMAEFFGAKNGGKLLEVIRGIKDVTEGGLFKEEDIRAVREMAIALEHSEKSLMVMASKWMPSLLASAENFVMASDKGSDFNKRLEKAYAMKEAFEKKGDKEGASQAGSFIDAARSWTLTDKEQRQMFGNLEAYSRGYRKPGTDENTGALARFEGAFSPFGSKNRGTLSKNFGPVPDQTLEDKVAAQTKALQDKVFDIGESMAFRKMNPGQQQRDLEKRIKQEEGMAHASRVMPWLNGGSEMDKQRGLRDAGEHDLKASELKSQLQDLIMGQKNNMSFDSRARIGGFTAFSDVGIRGLNLQERGVRAMESIDHKTKPPKVSPHPPD